MRPIFTLRELNGLGTELFMDDFGRGYSSLYYLKCLSMHSLKIDRFFVGGLGNGGDASIVHTIISISRGQGFKGGDRGRGDARTTGLSTPPRLWDQAQNYFLSRFHSGKLVPELILS